MNFKGILFETVNQVARITLNRPPMNVMDIPTILEILDALDQMPKETAIIVFSGAGLKGFSAGVDIKDHTTDKVEGMLKSFHQIFRNLAQSDMTTIAKVHGYCLGGGMELATFCDFVVAGENAVFGQPEIKVGCYPPVSAALLPKLIGAKKAFEIVMLGETLFAKEALDMGLVNQVVPVAALDQTVNELVHKLTGLSSAVLKKTKKALLAGTNQSFLNTLDEAERIYLKELLQTEDLTEGINAFMEKRKPNWKNR